MLRSPEGSSALSWATRFSDGLWLAPGDLTVLQMSDIPQETNQGVNGTDRHARKSKVQCINFLPCVELRIQLKPESRQRQDSGGDKCHIV